MSKEWKGISIYFVAIILIVVATMIARYFDNSQDGELTLTTFIISLWVVGVPAAILVNNIMGELK